MAKRGLTAQTVKWSQEDRVRRVVAGGWGRGAGHLMVQRFGLARWRGLGDRLCNAAGVFGTTDRCAGKRLERQA